MIPVASFAQTKRICDLCDASIPERLEAAMLAAGGDAEAEFELGVAFAAQQCAELLIAGVPGIHFYALNRAPATRAVLGALRASRPWERTRVEPSAPEPGLTRLQRLMGEFRYEGHRVTYDEYGTGERALVLIHGLLISRHMFDRLGPALAAGETG